MPTPVSFRSCLLPSAHVEGLRDGHFVSWGMTEYGALFNGEPAADELRRWRRIDSLEVVGDGIATASMSLAHGDIHFTDAFVLLRHAHGHWRIANKVYERA